MYFGFVYTFDALASQSTKVASDLRDVTYRRYGGCCSLNVLYVQVHSYVRHKRSKYVHEGAEDGREFMLTICFSIFCVLKVKKNAMSRTNKHHAENSAKCFFGRRNAFAMRKKEKERTKRSSSVWIHRRRRPSHSRRA